MEKISRALKELLPECIKENIKVLSVCFFTALGGILLNFVEKLNSIKVEVKLSIIFTVIIFLLVSIISIVILIKKQGILKKEQGENYNKLKNKHKEEMDILESKHEKKYNDLKEAYDELLEPPNENVQRFKVGDAVILKMEKGLDNPEQMIVTKLLKSEIECRDYKRELNTFKPEELLTAVDTQNLLLRIELENKRKLEEEERREKEFLDSFTSLNRQ